MSLGDAILIEVSVDVIPTLSQKDLDGMVTSGKGKRTGKNPSWHNWMDYDYELKTKIPLFASFE